MFEYILTLCVFTALIPGYTKAQVVNARKSTFYTSTSESSTLIHAWLSEFALLYLCY